MVVGNKATFLPLCHYALYKTANNYRDLWMQISPSHNPASASPVHPTTHILYAVMGKQLSTIYTSVIPSSLLSHLTGALKAWKHAPPVSRTASSPFLSNSWTDLAWTKHLFQISQSICCSPCTFYLICTFSLPLSLLICTIAFCSVSFRFCTNCCTHVWFDCNHV